MAVVDRDFYRKCVHREQRALRQSRSLTPTTRTVGAFLYELALASGSIQSGYVFPSMMRIAEECGGIRERSAKRCIKRLLENGWFEVVRMGKGGGGRGRANHYYPLDHATGQRLCDMRSEGSMARSAGRAPTTEDEIQDIETAEGITDFDDRSAFRDFYDAHPNARNMERTAREWRKAVDRGANPEILIAKAKRAKADGTARFSSSAWLKQRCYLDGVVMPLPRRETAAVAKPKTRPKPKATRKPTKAKWKAGAKVGRGRYPHKIKLTPRPRQASQQRDPRILNSDS